MDICIFVALCLLVCLEGANVYLVYCMIRAINMHNSAGKPEVPIEEGGIDLNFFNRPTARKTATFTRKSAQWIRNHERESIGGEIIGK